ncbi:MAG: cob(I)yrinic acid a,c-diamide adenosyltransferase [Saprospiraceae bacterium]|nr:cob(I)yrinic acid a,c-diamide adenosyltransferase [Saprospiraceae bacterium]
MKIYTKTGDSGMTGLFGGKRISKDDARIEAYGTLDELNSFLGYLNTGFHIEKYNDVILEVQNRLFDMGSHLACDPDKEPLPSGITSQDIVILENFMDEMDSELQPLKNFILPGGSQTVAQAHICRTVCRRAERRVVTLQQFSEIDPMIVMYLNRLSDFLFILARYLAFKSGIEELKWTGRKK